MFGLEGFGAEVRVRGWGGGEGAVSRAEWERGLGTR